MDSPAAPEQVPVIGIGFTIDLDPGKKLVLQTHLAVDASDGGLNKLLDRLASAGQRMEKRFLIPAVTKAIEVDKRHLEDAVKALQKLDLALDTKRQIFAADKKRGDFKEDQHNKSNRDALGIQIEELNRRIAKNSADLADLKKATDDDGSDGGTDLRAGA